MANQELPAYAEFDDYRYSQRIAVMVRWFVLVAWLSLVNYRANVEGGTLYALNGMGIGLAFANAYVQWRILRHRPVAWPHVLALSLLDLAIITIGIGITSRFYNGFFVFYYPALLGLSLVFPSARISFTIVTLLAAAYTGISLTLEPKLSFDAGHEKALIARIVTMFAVVSAGALMTRIERTRRREAVQAERVQLQRNFELQRQAEEAEEQARDRMAREIHDGIAQSIYALSLNIETCADLAEQEGSQLRERLKSLVPTAKKTLLETRHYIYDLKPLLSGEGDLASIAQSQVREFETVARMPVELSMNGDLQEVPVTVATGIYRILQEALANILKHSNASEVQVTLDINHGSLRLGVQDDGIGFDPSSGSLGYGLENMRQRAVELGGTFEISSSSEQGTCITVTAPQQERANAAH